jgi:hypothetical protein
VAQVFHVVARLAVAAGGALLAVGARILLKALAARVIEATAVEAARGVGVTLFVARAAVEEPFAGVAVLAG